MSNYHRDDPKKEEPDIVIDNAVPAQPLLQELYGVPVPPGHSRFYCEKCRTVRRRTRKKLYPPNITSLVPSENSRCPHFPGLWFFFVTRGDVFSSALYTLSSSLAI